MIIISVLLVGLSHVRQTSHSTERHASNQTFPIDQASSLWVVVNKGRALPANYAPSPLRAPDMPLRLKPSDSEMLLRSDAASALETLNQAAREAGWHLMLASGYRSYDQQVGLYSFYVQSQGQNQADEYSARPGHSEHQTGLAADLEPASRQCEVEDCFAATPEGRWLAANAYKYGFIIRYGQDQAAVTGYNYEPWHVRYIGDQLAAQLQANHKTLEQYFKLPVYSSYPSHSLLLKR